MVQPDLHPTSAPPLCRGRQEITLHDMSSLVASLLFITSFLGTRYAGMDRTINILARAGKWQRRALRRVQTPGAIRTSVERGYRWLPLPIMCLEQAIVTWYLMNLNGHRATLKIGAMLSPLMSHAWTEANGEIFGYIADIPDMQVVAEYPHF
jgi:Transglutaminase-like superfamily